MVESEMAILRKEIAFMVDRIDKVEKENTELKKLVVFYESENMSTLTPFLYNRKCDSFYESR